MIRITPGLLQTLTAKGVECHLTADKDHVSPNACFEPPCGVKRLDFMHSSRLGAFSYGVSGFVSETTIGRYVSMGEMVQIGRGAHPILWMSTSPFFYAYGGGMFGVGHDFPDADRYHAFRPGPPGTIPVRNPRTMPDVLVATEIGHDVWVGHGAFIGQGVKVGNGAVVAGHSVVVKDVPDYAIVAGNPAEIKGFRFGPKQIAALLELEWWNYAPWQLEGVPFGEIDAAIARLQQIVPHLSRYEPGWVRVGDLSP
ncbi:CatB-related O-acetyltransferase [Methylobacterium aquaticum]|jgi:acetyltransferase-like isoleucine patch superfamily enzyme|uniref:Transferase n=1 Tax=Methylobacterium aquaticum TaxID=270351 RepID=A0A0J6T228_9HYPH|nr:CatB-related O-acetyltransferase [Methylobacterium aquaticum]KMO40029.1 hypothetical protein VP06_03120 [Methylobacterium aquaticum]